MTARTRERPTPPQGRPLLITSPSTASDRSGPVRRRTTIARPYTSFTDEMLAAVVVRMRRLDEARAHPPRVAELGGRVGRTTAETARRSAVLDDRRTVARVEIAATLDTLTIDVAAGRCPLLAAVRAGGRLIEIGGLP